MEPALCTTPPAGHGSGTGASEFVVYLHSSQRVDGRSPARALMTDSARLDIASVLLSGDEGFGRRRRLRGASAEGPVPLIVVATAPNDASAGAFATLLAHLPAGIVTTWCRVARLDAAVEPLVALGDHEAQLVVHCRSGTGRDDPAGIGGVTELLRRHGVAGATALSGGAGTVDGAHFQQHVLAPAPAVPARVIAVDAASRLSAAVPALVACDAVDLVTARPIWVWKRRGRLGGTPIGVDADGWRVLSVFTADDTNWNSPHRELLARLRVAGAAGATVVPGRLGYARDGPLRPRRGWRGRRAAPMVTMIVDTRDRIAGWFEIVDEVTGDDGLVTCEAVHVRPPPP